MSKRDLVSIAQLTPEEIARVLSRAEEIKSKPSAKALAGKILALVFQKPSLRTRVSFDVAMYQLGGHTIYLPESEIGMGEREPVADVAQVLSRYVNGIVARTYRHQDIIDLAHYSRVPVINGLSDVEHPCQALADLLTIQEKKGTLKEVTVTFVGDGNNVANSLLLACSMMGVHFRIASPPQYSINPALIKQARQIGQKTGCQIQEMHDPKTAVQGADVVYTDVWVSMGQEAEAKGKESRFAGYQVNEALLAAAKKDAVFMHPLPAHEGHEIAPHLLEHPQSVVYDQAENRLHVQKAVLLELLT